MLQSADRPAGSAEDGAALVALLQNGQGPVDTPVRRIRAEGGPRAAADATLGLFAAAAIASATSDLSAWRAEGIHAVPYTHPDRYPERLRDVDSAPALIFTRGELTASDGRGVAIIGTRHPTSHGVARAQALARVLVTSGRTVISGLAAGIDTAAHAEALRVGGRSVAVLGNGVRRAYPAQNAALQAQLPALVSQFLPDQEPTRKTFPMRNAAMSALSSATVIVEAGGRSGARIQARHAMAQGRPLFLMESLLDQPWAAGLVGRAGVHVLTEPAELIDRLAACGA